MANRKKNLTNRSIVSAELNDDQRKEIAYNNYAKAMAELKYLLDDGIINQEEYDKIPKAERIKKRIKAYSYKINQEITINESFSEDITDLD
jgi:hypothetical protein